MSIAWMIPTGIIAVCMLAVWYLLRRKDTIAEFDLFVVLPILTFAFGFVASWIIRGLL